jgi:hypothetical protein
MKINFAVVSNNTNHYLSVFLKDIGFIYNSLEGLEDLNKKYLLIVDQKAIEKKNDVENFLKKNTFKKNLGLIMVPRILKKNFENIDCRKIYYPIKIDEFIKSIKNYNFFSNIFLNTILNESNFLINLSNNKKIYLTDTEYKILQCLFDKKIFKKEKLKVEILNFHNSLETKSLESHLSRIRRKIEKIDSKISIVSVDNQFVKII